MKDVKLVVPSAQYLMSYLEACREMKASGVTFSTLSDPDTFDCWKDTLFERMEDYRLGRNIKPGHVPASVFWLVQDDEMIGVGNIRHSLTPALERLGGHIGYAIRPSKWNQGYGTLQLKLLLREANKLGISRALLTCDERNIASARVMEKNGGVYQDTIDNVMDGQPIRLRRYWIDTAP